VTIWDFYLDVLGREPEPEGLHAWTQFLDANCHQDGFRVLAEAFFDSPEFRLTRPLTLPDLVGVMYRVLLARDPDAGGLAFWTDLLRQARLALASAFVGSAEFQAHAPRRGDRSAATGLITRFYAEFLGRMPDPSGLRFWVDHVMTSGDIEGTARGFLASGEFETRALTFREYVTLLYRGILARLPEPARLESWDAVLRGHLLNIIDAGFTPSPEFAARVANICG
jgi:hypothetical protein